MDFEIEGDTTEETLENVSFLTLFIAAVFVVVGISVGTFVPGIPVALALFGSFLVVVGLAIYIVSELMRLI